MYIELDRGDIALLSCVLLHVIISLYAACSQSSFFLSALPDAPTDVIVSQVMSRSAQIQWLAPRPRPGPVVNTANPMYVVQYRSSEMDDWTERGEDDIEAELSYSLTGLLPYTFYDLRVVPYSNYGRGTPSQTVQFKTQETGG